MFNHNATEVYEATHRLEVVNTTDILAQQAQAVTRVRKNDNPWIFITNLRSGNSDIPCVIARDATKSLCSDALNNLEGRLI
jgi:hypothetical protein